MIGRGEGRKLRRQWYREQQAQYLRVGSAREISNWHDDPEGLEKLFARPFAVGRENKMGKFWAWGNFVS